MFALPCRCLRVLLTASLTAILLRPTVVIDAADKEQPIPICLPGAKAGIGFDDLGFSSSVQRVLVLAGHCGTLDLIGPRNGQIPSIRGFAASSAFSGARGEGIT
jgi:hypothetical protein